VRDRIADNGSKKIAAIDQNRLFHRIVAKVETSKNNQIQKAKKRR